MQKYINTLKDKKFIIVYIAIALIVVVLLSSYFMAKKVNVTDQSSSQDQKTTEKQNTTLPKSTTGSTNTNTNTSPSISYSQAVQLYTNKTIQFDENCVVSPSYASFKQGEKIMLDNRASKQRSIHLDGKEYIFSAYDFKIITLSTPDTLPHTIMIDCGSGKNNGRILLQQ